MARRVKLHTWLKPGSVEYKAVVHAYFHLLQHERFLSLALLATMSNAPSKMIEDFNDTADGHYIAFAEQIRHYPQFEGYLLERSQENMEWRVFHQANCIIRDGEAHAMTGKRSKSNEKRRRQQARYN